MQKQYEWWQAIIIGASGGLTIFLVGLIKEQILIWRDKRRVYNFLFTDRNSVWKFRNTWTIASNVNLTEERVRFICSIHKKIKRSAEEDEVWQLREQISN
jgi:hypothetical protein